MTDTKASPSDGNVKDTKNIPINLEQLLDTYGEEDLREIFLLFKDETRQILDTLISAIKEQERQTTQALAHQMKGLSAVITAVEMEELCHTIEKSIKIDDWEHAKKAATGIDQSFQAVLKVIDEYLAKHSSN